MKDVYMVLTNGFDPDVRVYKEAKYLVEKGFNVTVLCWDRNCVYNKNDSIDGINIVRFLIPSRAGTGFKQLFSYFKFAWKVKKYLSKKNYSYLHCHDFDGALIGYFSCRRKSRLVFDMHEIYSNYSYAKNPIFKYLIRRIIKRCYKVLYVTELQKKYAKEENLSKYIYLPNYPEKSIYTPIKKNKNKIITINYIGSVRDYDSLKTLIELSDISDKYSIGLYGVGTAYEKLVNDFNKSKVYFHGKYDGINDIGDIYRKTDILYCVYNPNIENWRNAYPVKLFESLITSTPIIVSNSTAVGDFVVKNKIGEVIEYDSVKSLQNAVNKIVNNYSKYVENIEKIASNYQLETVIKNLDIVYDIYLK